MEHKNKKLSWYPGHIAKAINEMGKHISMVDVVIHIIDSRAARGTLFGEILKLAQNKPVILFLNKADLSDPAVTKKWIEQYTSEGYRVIAGSTADPRTLKHIKQTVTELTKEKLSKYAAKGMATRSSRVMITGMPNVGKSTLINRLIGQSKVRVANKPGVTRQVQWVRIAPDIELLDTPGILPIIQDNKNMHTLAIIGMVGDKAFESVNIASFVYNNYPEVVAYLRETYKAESLEEILSEIARQKGFIVNGTPDMDKASTFVLKGLQDARFKRWSFEKP